MKQNMATLWCCPASYSRLHMHLRCHRVRLSSPKPAKEAEKVQEVGVQEASHVYVRVGAVTIPLDATYCGPYCVLIKEKKKLLLEIGATRQWVSVDRKKPHMAAAAPSVAQLPLRGRPSKS